MKKKLKWIFGALVVVFVLLQLTNPARTNPPVVSDLMATNPPPPQIAAILHAACYDCHSYETKWPWYSHIAPVSWLIASDVNGARRKMNFSDWPSGRPDWEVRRLEDMSDEVQSGDMPPMQYKLIHVAARLTKSQRKQLGDWLDSEAARLKSAAATPK
jgi:Haem-binding domain